MERRGSRVLLWGLIGGILLVLCVPLLLVILTRPQVPVVAVPTPNAVDTLASVGAMVRDLPDDLMETTDLDVLQAALAENESLMADVNRALTQEACVPIDYEQGFDGLSDQVSPLRQAFRLVWLAARVQELEGNLDEAALRYADLFRLARKSPRGGVTMHFLFGCAGEAMALERLVEVTRELDPSVAEQLTAKLSDPVRQLVDLDAMMDREHLLVRKQYGAVRGTWMIWMTQQGTTSAEQQTKARDASLQALYEQVLEQLSAAGDSP